MIEGERCPGPFFPCCHKLQWLWFSKHPWPWAHVLPERVGNHSQLSAIEPCPGLLATCVNNGPGKFDGNQFFFHLNCYSNCMLHGALFGLQRSFSRYLRRLDLCQKGRVQSLWNCQPPLSVPPTLALPRSTTSKPVTALSSRLHFEPSTYASVLPTKNISRC